MKDSVFCSKKNLVLLPGEFATDEYDYVMGDDGVIKKYRKKSSSNEASKRKPKKKKSNIGTWIFWIYIILCLLNYIISNNA